jgi:hypothetical protein
MRVNESGHWVGDETGWVAFWEAWPWGEEMPNPAYFGDRVTIIALDVPADATADDLRALAESFERMHVHVQVGEGDEALLVPAWEVARDLVDCPACEAPLGHPCCGLRADGEHVLLHGEVHIERLEREQNRGAR